jgi:hypothetical protein
MKEQVNLEKLGELVSKAFVDNKTPMNDSLKKFASHYGLNTMQVSRVAEHANVKTHLHMLSNTDSPASYVQFPIADPTVATTATILKEAGSLEDYNSRPAENSYADDLFDSVFYIKKEASAQNTSPEVRYKEVSTKIAQLANQHNQLMEASVVLETQLTPIYKLVKQAALGGVPTEQLAHAILASADTGEYIISEIAPALTKDGISLNTEDLTKVSSLVVNPNNELVKKVSEFDKLAKQLIIMHNTYEEALAELGDHPLEKQAQNSLA